VLDLEAGVHLQKRRRSVVSEEELARPGTDVADRTAKCQRGIGEPAPGRRIDRRRGRLLEDLLMAALDRAVTLAEVDAGAVAVEQELDLDMARAVEVSLEDEPIVTEGHERFAP